jgi:hypothetical protein
VALHPVDWSSPLHVGTRPSRFRVQELDTDRPRCLSAVGIGQNGGGCCAGAIFLRSCGVTST